MSSALIGSLIGLMAMSGLLTVISRVRATAPPSIPVRVALHRGTRTLDHQESGPLSAYVALIRPRMLQTSDSVSRRLSSAGRSGGMAQLRWDQLAWGGCGLGAGIVVAWWSILRDSSPVALIVLPAIGAALGVLLLDRRIARQAKKRRARIEDQLPDVAELLAFAVAAGESMIPALHRVSGMIRGDLGDELGVVVAEASTGIPLERALRSASDRMDVPVVERFVDGLVISLERGTPLVGVVRAQASDARTVQQQALIEEAGKKDVVMLMPVVFLILPTVVAIALFPGLRGLETLVS